MPTSTPTLPRKMRLHTRTASKHKCPAISSERLGLFLSARHTYVVVTGYVFDHKWIQVVDQWFVFTGQLNHFIRNANAKTPVSLTKHPT